MTPPRPQTWRLRVWTRFLDPPEEVAVLAQASTAPPGGAGLYSRYEHQRLLEPTSDGTRFVDDIVFSPATPLPWLAARLLRRFFVLRHRRAARGHHGDGQATGVAVLREVLPEEG